MRLPPPPSRYPVISDTGSNAVALCRASSCSTSSRSSRTNSKISFAVRRAISFFLASGVILLGLRERGHMRPGKTEEAPKVLGSPCSRFFRAQVSHIAQHLCYFRHVGRFISLAAIRHRRQVRSVRFDQNVLQRQSFRNVAQILRLRKSPISRKRNLEANVHATLRVFERARKAVQNSAKSRRRPLFFQNFHAIRPRIAAMNHDWLFCRLRKLHLLPKHFCLRVAR